MRHDGLPAWMREMREALKQSRGVVTVDLIDREAEGLTSVRPAAPCGWSSR